AGKLFSLDGRVALVTGASSGLGLRFAEVAAANGAAVVLVARRVKQLDAVRVKIEKAGGRAAVAVADVTDQANMRRAFDAAEKAFGTVDVLVANAGIVRVARALETSPEMWREVMATNLDAVFFTAQEAANRMVAAGKPGAIVTIASISGFAVERGVAAYSVSKAGVIQATRALALELARKGIRVNAIAPGYTVTDLNRDFLMSDKGAAMREQIPLGRFGEIGDLDGAFLLLASDAGRWITGATVLVDGGHLLAMGG
ncbi:MAG: SDR family NAD(P)-dependent oxidoreductase, partial [Xanthobacteraceae bacterium]|nr:SDR family NAD(P)-dependent oxidoreductase [Xanthobacteraceae bacterium]